MKQPIRYFSIGLLISTLLLFGYFSYFYEEEKPEVITTELTTEEMVDKVEAEGFKVLTNEQYIALSLTKEETDADKDNVDKEKEKDKDKEQEKDKDKDNKPAIDKKENEENEEDEEDEGPSLITHTFVTKDDVTASKVAKILEENNIIDDEYEFLSYMEENDYMKYVQIGKFTVSNDMSFKDIAEIITTYPGN